MEINLQKPMQMIRRNFKHLEKTQQNKMNMDHITKIPIETKIKND